MAECGLLDLATCLPQKLFEYLITILNAPLQPLLSSIKDLLSEPIQLQLFMSLWVIIVYMLSMFYAFLIMYSGFSFIIAGQTNPNNGNRRVVVSQERASFNQPYYFASNKKYKFETILGKKYNYKKNKESK